MFVGKTLGTGLSLGHLGENGEAGSRESSVLVGHHVSTDVNAWWNEQVFIMEKCEWWIKTGLCHGKIVNEISSWGNVNDVTGLLEQTERFIIQLLQRSKTYYRVKRTVSVYIGSDMSHFI